MKTTNYYNTFIEVSEDCPISTAEIPPVKGENQSVANIQFDMMSRHPYKFTSDDVVFQVFATKNNVGKSGREEFFSKGQACLRASPLVKRYGWGVHCDAEGKVAIYGIGSAEYEQYLKRKELTHVKGMRSKRV